MSHSSTDKWYYRQQGRELGPVSFASLAALARNGRLHPDDQVGSSQSVAMRPAREVDGLFVNLGAPSSAEKLDELRDLSELDIDSFQIVDSAPASKPSSPPPQSKAAPAAESAIPPPAQQPTAEANAGASFSRQAVPAGNDPVWYCWVGGREQGPLSLEHLRQWVAQHWLSPHDYLKIGPAGAWFAAASVKELFPAAAPPQQPQPSSVQRGGQSTSTNKPPATTGPVGHVQEPMSDSPARRSADVAPPAEAKTGQPAPGEAQPRSTKKETAASSGVTSQSADEVYQSINAQAIRSITEAAKSGANRSKETIKKKPAAPRPPSPPPVASPPKVKRPSFDASAQLEKIKEFVCQPKVLAVAGAVVLVLAVGFLWSRMGSGKDLENYEVIAAVFEEFQRKRELNASATEWDQFSRETIERLQPLIATLDNTASRSAPQRQYLLWAAKDCLPQMLNDARTEESESERQFVGYLEEARRMIVGDD